MIEQLGEVFESMSPGQEVNIEGSWEVLPNLAESPIGSDFNPKTLRIQVNSSFEMESLLAIRKEDSQEAARVLGALQSTRTEVMCSYPSSWVEVAIFPDILPEHNLRSMTRFIDSLPRNSNMPDQYIIVWSDHYRYASSVKCATMYASRELVTGLQALLERNSPIKYRGMSITPILSSEKTEVSYYQDVFQKHTAMTQGRQVLRIGGVPQWLKLESLKITAEVLQQEVQEHQAGWTVADLLMRLTPEGVVSFSSEGVFTEVLPGNRGDSIVLCFHRQQALRAWKCQDEVMRIISTAGGSASKSKLKIEMIPPIELQDEDNAQEEMAQEHENGEESSVSSSESSEPPQRKQPGHEPNLESQPPARQLERLMEIMQERAESMANVEAKLEKLTVSMTSMSTEISDLKTQSEANVKTSAVARMNEQQLETFINERCVPKFVDQVIAKQKEMKIETTKQQQEMLSQVSSSFAEVVREELHLSYPTAEQHLVTTFRKCLQEAVREMRKVTGQDDSISTPHADLSKQRDDEGNQPQSLSPPSQEFPTLYKGWEEEASRGADRTLRSALEVLQSGRHETEEVEEDATESETNEQHPMTIEFRTGTLIKQKEAGESEPTHDLQGLIFEVEGEMSNLTAPNFGGGKVEAVADTAVPCDPESPIDEVVEGAEHDHTSSEHGTAEEEQHGDPMLSLEAREVDEAKPPAAPVKRYNTRNRASRPDATGVTPTNLNEDQTHESSEVEPSVRGREEGRDDAPNVRRNRSNSAKSKKEKDLTGGHADITQFLSPK
jgi:regulator of replication initiation timing